MVTRYGGRVYRLEASVGSCGKRFARVWTLDKPAKYDAGRPCDREAAVYRFRLTLQDSGPAIWRRIETKDVRLEKLHELIQTAIGWMMTCPANRATIKQEEKTSS